MANALEENPFIFPIGKQVKEIIKYRQHASPHVYLMENPKRIDGLQARIR
jgi:hypothetical protein